MKNLLLLAIYFVPRNHIASYRAGCFAKYLPENGWMPTVFCEDWPKDRPDYDADFVGPMPDGVEVFRIPRSKLQGFYQKVILRKLCPYLWPHRAPILWWRQARAEIQAQLKRKEFHAVWATSDPLVPMALAQEAARQAGLPWVADIRDSYNVQKFGSWYKRPLFAFQERRLCKHANRVVTVSDGIAGGLGRRIGRQIEVIHNGFDLTLLPASPPPRTRLFTIVYAGHIFLPHRNPAPLFQAVEICIQRKLIPRNEIEVQFYGTDGGLVEKVFPGAAERLPLKLLPRVPHNEILRIQMSSSMLLVLSHATERGVLTGKIFDYLAAGRPILAVPDDRGEVAALLKQTGAGVSLTTVEEIAALLTAWHKAWKTNTPMITTRNEPAIARYSRREQTKRLAAILDEISKP